MLLFQLNTSLTTGSEESEYETLEEDNGNDNHSYGSDRSSRSRHSLHSLEDGDQSDSIIIEDEREDGDGEEVSLYCLRNLKSFQL